MNIPPNSFVSSAHYDDAEKSFLVSWINIDTGVRHQVVYDNSDDIGKLAQIMKQQNDLSLLDTVEGRAEKLRLLCENRP